MLAVAAGADLSLKVQVLPELPDSIIAPVFARSISGRTDR
jgi:hypothetical protein